MAIITYPLNGVTYNAEDAEGYLCTRTSGVYSAEDSFRAWVSGTREITIYPGVAWIQNTPYSGKSIVSRDPVKLTIPEADGALPRLDSVVLRFDKAKNGSELVIVKGEPMDPPTAPLFSRSETLYELCLYTILIPAASLSVSNSDITNTMMDEMLCGIMRDGVTGLPTNQLHDQWRSMVNDMAVALENVKGGNLVSRHQYNATARLSGWTRQNDGRYTNNVTVSGITANDEGNIDIDMSDATVSTAQELTNGWSLVDKAETVTGGLLLTCFYDIPMIDLPLIIEVIR